MPFTNKHFQLKVARIFESVGSTNDALIRALNAGAGLSSGAVFVAREQAKGRGQGTNRWHTTPHENLTFSFLLRPDDLSVDRLFDLNRWVSLAVAETVRSYVKDPGSVTVKWPNDIYVDNRKIAGILIQNGLRGNQVAWSVIGVGLNVNENNWPRELNATATSIYRETDQLLDIDDTFSRFADRIARHLPEMSQLRANYNNQLYLLQKDHLFTDLETGNPIAGKIIGTTDNGKLRLLRHDGKVLTYAQRTLRYHQPTPYSPPPTPD